MLASVGVTLALSCGVVIAQEADTTPPETTIDEGPPLLDFRSVPSFSFSSNEQKATFECKLDKGSFEACASPKTYYHRHLPEGQHTFAVKAKDRAGNVDPTPARYAWEIDLTAPKITWLEKPGTSIDRRSSVTNDTTPTWAYTFSDKNLGESDPACAVHTGYPSYKLGKFVVPPRSCPSPTTVPFELADGSYEFEVRIADKAGNRVNMGIVGYIHAFEVDTVAPKFISGKPTGKGVRRGACVVASFDDVWGTGSAKFVNIYEKGSSKRLAVNRSTRGNKIELSPKDYLERNTWYTVKITTKVNDGANTLEKPHSWSFKTKR